MFLRLEKFFCFFLFLAGTYEVTDFKRAYGSSVLKAASTETAVGAKEVDNTWKHVQNISTVSTMEVRAEVGSEFDGFLSARVTDVTCT